MCLQSLQSILILILIFMFMFAFLAPELFYLDKEIVNQIERDPVKGPTILYYKVAGFGNF